MTASVKDERLQRDNAVDYATIQLHEVDRMLRDPSITDEDKTALRGLREQVVDEIEISRSEGDKRHTMDRNTKDLRRVVDLMGEFMDAAQDNRIANRGAGVERVATSVDADSEWGVDGVPDITDGSGIQQLIANDPEGFAELWAATSAEDRQMIMFSLQEHSQVQAQLQTMLTNLLQNQHQATMAIARNLSA